MSREGPTRRRTLIACSPLEDMHAAEISRNELSKLTSSIINTAWRKDSCNGWRLACLRQTEDSLISDSGHGPLIHHRPSLHLRFALLRGPWLAQILFGVPNSNTKCTHRPFCAQGGPHGKVSHARHSIQFMILDNTQGRSSLHFPTSVKRLQTTLP